MTPIAGVPSGVVTALAWGQEARETSPGAGRGGGRAIPGRSVEAAAFAGGPQGLRGTAHRGGALGHGIAESLLARAPLLSDGAVLKGLAVLKGPAGLGPLPRKDVNGDRPGGTRDSNAPCAGTDHRRCRRRDPRETSTQAQPPVT